MAKRGGEKEMIFKSEVLWVCILVLIAIACIIVGLLLINQVAYKHEMRKIMSKKEEYLKELKEEFKEE